MQVNFTIFSGKKGRGVFIRPMCVCVGGGGVQYLRIIFFGGGGGGGGGGGTVFKGNFVGEQQYLRVIWGGTVFKSNFGKENLSYSQMIRGNCGKLNKQLINKVYGLSKTGWC